VLVYGFDMSRDRYAEFLKDLRNKRLKRKLTQAQVAQGIKLSRAQYTAIEQGRSLLNWNHLHKLSTFMKTSFTIRA
jgi:transcriptional regulator with XRE-family HTH domain